MNKRIRANELKAIIMERIPVVTDCHVLWSSTAAKQYGGKLPGSHAIGFAMIIGMDKGDDLQVVCPVAKSVAFDDRFDHTFDIVLLCLTAVQGVLTYNMALEVEKLENAILY